MDHFNECTEFVNKYLTCMKHSKGQNSETCRSLAKQFLDCRMKHGLMDRDEWKNLGLPDDNK